MAFHKVERTYARLNFLDSEVGLVQKTREIPQSMGTDQDNRKIVIGGTPFPSNDANAEGLVFETIDVTDELHWRRRQRRRLKSVVSFSCEYKEGKRYARDFRAD